MIAKSFFIPSISYDMTKEHVRQFFSEYGTVCRVDFVSHNNDKGLVRRAFVHFVEYDEQTEFQTTMNTYGYVDVNIHAWLQHMYPSLFENNYNGNGFVRVLINKNPIPQTTLNIDQIAFNTEFIGEQQKELDKKIVNLEHQLEQCHRTIEALLSHLNKDSDSILTNKHGVPIAPCLNVNDNNGDTTTNTGTVNKVLRKIVMY